MEQNPFHNWKVPKQRWIMLFVLFEQILKICQTSFLAHCNGFFLLLHLTWIISLTDCWIFFFFLVMRVCLFCFRFHWQGYFEIYDCLRSRFHWGVSLLQLCVSSRKINVTYYRHWEGKTGENNLKYFYVKKIFKIFWN